MWLDRLASPAISRYSRDYPSSERAPSQQRLSPANQARRTASNPRSSPLSNSPSNAATNHKGTQQPAARRFNHDEAEIDPMEVLQGIIGKRKRKTEEKGVPEGEAAPAAVTVAKPDHELVVSIDFGDLSLEEYANAKDNRQAKPKRTYEPQSIEKFNEDRHRFQGLHDVIAECDDVLRSVETYLDRFQTDLGVVSAEIESLQSRSSQLNSQLKNRRNLEKLLGPAVQSITVSPASVHAIAEGPVDHAFVKALKEVDETGRYIEANEKGQGPGKIKAIEDVKPLLEDLKTKAIMRIRDHIVAQIKSIRAPNVNAQIIQQRQLLRYKEIFGFLHRNHAQLAGELTQAYVNTMKWYYTSHFTRYVQALEKIKIQTVDRNDLMGSDPMASQRTAYQGTRLPGHDPFILGRRLDILKTHSSMAISSQLAEDDKSTHGIEVPFRHFTLALIDNVSAEYAFTTDFFSPSITYPILSRHVSTIFAPTFSLGQSLTRTLIEHSTDCLGILLCVRLAQHFAFELQRRRCPVADGYINAVNMILWPRFQIVMDMHCESLRKFTAGVSTTAAPVLAVSSATSAAPHYFTQRYGTFLEGLLALSSEAGDDEPVSNSLARLSAEFDALLVKLARASGEPKRRERFLVNNYSLILTIISDTQGKLAVEQKEHLTQKMKEAGGKK